MWCTGVEGLIRDVRKGGETLLTSLEEEIMEEEADEEWTSVHQQVHSLLPGF